MGEEIREVLPEIELIDSDSLQLKVVQAWETVLEESEFDDLTDVPALPLNEDPWAIDVDNIQHTRGVTELSQSLIETFTDLHEIDVNQDHILAGALCHDIGKCIEFENLDTGRYIKRTWESSNHAVRHPIYSAAIGWSVGLPREVLHIVANHSREGEEVIRNTESTIVHYADYMYWEVTIRQTIGLSVEELMATDKMLD